MKPSREGLSGAGQKIPLSDWEKYAPWSQAGCSRTEAHLSSLENRIRVIEKASPLYLPIKVCIQYLCSKMGKTKELIKIKAGRPPGWSQPGFAEFLIILPDFLSDISGCLNIPSPLYIPPITKNADGSDLNLIVIFLLYRSRKCRKYQLSSLVW